MAIWENEALKDSFRLILAIISSALSAAGMVILVNLFLSTLPSVNDNFLKAVIGLVLVLVGSGIGILAGKKAFGVVP